MTAYRVERNSKGLTTYAITSSNQNNITHIIEVTSHLAPMSLHVSNRL